VHFGVDLFALSSQVFAPENGVVIDVADGQSAPFVGFGPGVILMKGASGFFHLLAHLNFGTIVVRPGQQISEGQFIALFDPGIGHTHWEVRIQRLGSTPPNAIDPINAWLRGQLALQTPRATPATLSSTGQFVAGFTVVAGLVGLSWLALRIAKNAAQAT
jgi:murein DD-endopeptidase MepM/ murein hydrolase activator NlpD